MQRFQSTLQRTERPEDKIINAVAHISIHAPANGATHSNSHMPDSAEFQSTLRRTERLESKAGWKGLCNFNPRSGERSDTISIALPAIVSNFNPRSGERSDITEKQLHDYLNISIHAPANGATYTSPSLAKYITISIHAPANGATFSYSPLISSTRQFQSTLRRTERL